MSIITNMYQHYIWMIGQLKEVHNMSLVVPHKDSHEMFHDGKPKFKLLFGQFEGQEGECIVFCPHIYMEIKEAIVWFSRVASLHPTVLLWDVYIEDDRGEYYLGEDAYELQDLYRQKAVLEHWLENADETEIKDFVSQKTFGRFRDPTKMYDTVSQRNIATDEFMRILKPDSDDEIH